MPPKEDRNAKNSIQGYVNACRRKISKADEFMKEFEDGDVMSNDEDGEANGMIKSLKEQFERLELDWQNNLQNTCEVTDFVSLQEFVGRTEEEINKCIKDIRAFVRKHKANTANAVSAATTPTNNSTPRFDTSLKPNQNLLASCNLEEFNMWVDQFTAYFNFNEKVFRTQGPEVRRQFLNNCIDVKLQNALRTDDTITQATAVLGEDGFLAKLKDIFLKDFPIFVRRYQFNQCKQGSRQPFTEWWVLKKSKASECDLDKITKDEVMMLELISGVNDPKLREEFLKTKDPTLEKLVGIAEQWQTASNVGKNFSSTSNCYKTSDYKANKNNQWQKDRGNSQARSNNSHDHQSRSKCRKCGFSKCKGGNECYAKNQTCFNCDRQGHLQSMCNKERNGNRQRSQTPGPNHGKGETKTHFVRIYHTKPNDDCEPTPLAWVNIVTKSGKTFKCGIIPDSGSFQSIISKNLVNKYGMSIDKGRKKKILAADGQFMDCGGSVDFEIEYEGERTEVQSLVSSDLKDDILVGWRTLQRLGILHENFPHVIKSTQCNFAQCSCIKCHATKCEQNPKLRIEEVINEYSEVFEVDGPLKTMKGGQMEIHLKDDVPIKPTHIYNARKCPYAFENQAKEELDKNEMLGIIEKVEDVSDWCSPMQFVRKPNGGCRSVVDLTGLNQYVKRPTHPFPVAKDIVSTIPSDVACFAVFDCKHGYWQLELDDKSKPLTTFLTEFGRYRYKRAPMGLSASGDEFCLRTDKALVGIPGVKKLVDDVLIYGKDDDELIERVRQVFEKCKEWSITLSKTKYQFGSTVKFAGFILGKDGVKPDPEKIAAIKDFPPPKDITNLRSWIGLVNQFSSYAPDLKHAMLPLQGLSSTKNAFHWTIEHDNSMEQIKKILTDENGPVLKHFDPKLPVALLTDASRKGLGYILIQRDDCDHPRLITCGSRFLSLAEKNYAVVELECLAIQWAITKCRLYLAGIEFIVRTDHKPLLGILNGKNLDAVNNTRIQRMMSKLLGYSFRVEWVAGKKHEIADALSRAPVFSPEEQDNFDVLVQFLKIEDMDPALKDLLNQAENDQDYQSIVQALNDGKNVNNLPMDHPALFFKNQWSAMSFETDHGLLLYHGRIIPPKTSRKKILEALHIQHTGITKTLRNAKQLYFWPFLKNDVVQMVNSCEKCMSLLPSHAKEPLIQTVAKRPFEALSVDLGYQAGKNYLICADRYSGWPMIKPLTKLDTSTVIGILEDYFVDVGKPLRIRSDDGPQFRSEFTNWCESRNIIHEKSSAYHPESNGHAEVTVREMKHLLAKTENWRKFRSALLEWRNTPRYDGLSPAQWVFGRRQRSENVALPSAYDRIPNEVMSGHEARRGRMMEEIKKYFDTGKRTMFPLADGAHVVVQDPKSKRWTRHGIVLERRNNGRSYFIEMNGKRFLRNRRFLRPCLNQRDSEETDVSPSETFDFKPILRRSERLNTKGKKVNFKL